MNKQYPVRAAITYKKHSEDVGADAALLFTLTGEDGPGADRAIPQMIAAGDVDDSLYVALLHTLVEKFGVPQVNGWLLSVRALRQGGKSGAPMRRMQ